jgi:leader peptidase (prepilin peptidase)/N-methyltransferase
MSGDLSWWASWQGVLTPWGMGLLGMLVGSFLNVVVHRMPLMQERRWWGDVAAQLGDADSHQRVLNQPLPTAASGLSKALQAALDALPALGLARPRSRCPKCGHQIRWYENIPVFSWLWLRGRCSACKTGISARYPAVELMTGAVFAALAWRFDAQPVTLLWCTFAAVLLAASLIDWDTTLLPDDLTLPLMWGGLLAALLGWTLPLPTALVGAMAGYLSLWGVYWLFKLTTGKEGMGYGDFKLLAALGAWLGWQAILPILLMASIIGAAVGLAMKASGALREGRYVPFGPFLAGGGLAVTLLGLPLIFDWLGWH